MPIAATAVIPRAIPQPALPADPLTEQNCRLLWDQIGQLRALVVAQEATIANLVTAVNILETELVSLRDAAAASGITTGNSQSSFLR